MQRGGVAVEPAEVLHVGRLDVACRSSRRSAQYREVGQLDHLGDLDRVVTMVGQPQGLVVDETVGITALAQQVHRPVGAPDRPVMHAVEHLGLRAPTLDRLAKIMRPGVRVADLRPPQRVGVVQGVAAVLRRGERTQLIDEPVHLRGRLGVRREHELERETVDVKLLTGLGDRLGRRDQRDAAQRDRRPEAQADVALGVEWDQRPVLVQGPAGHHVARHDVLRHRRLQEPLRRDHAHLARDNVVLGDDPLHAPVVVDVPVRIDHGDDRLLRPVLEIQRQRGLRIPPRSAGRTRSDRCHLRRSSDWRCRGCGPGRAGRPP
jgi:hypothetical protein